MTSHSIDRMDTNVEGVALSPYLLGRIWLLKQNLQSGKLWDNARHFGKWLEYEASVYGIEHQHSTITIDLNDDADITDMRIGPGKYPSKYEGDALLWKFFSLLGVRTIMMDVRLNTDQFQAVLALLNFCRKSIAKIINGKKSRSISRHLFDGKGIHISCTNCLIQDKTLIITYSYCEKRFAQLVKWHKNRHKVFSDHRAIFHATPSYTVSLTLLVMGPVWIYAIYYRNYTLLSLSIFSGLMLAILVYLLFITVGSVEYDNEEKAYYLRKAYGKLRRHIKRIQADIKEARDVQQRFLPDIKQMPLPDKLDWSFSFTPADEVAGDYFDVHQLDDSRIAILFSDVCGHGMAAAFVTAILKTTFQEWINCREPLERLAVRLNTGLCNLTLPHCFAALFVAVYDARTEEIMYINGGHHPEPWLIPVNESVPIDQLTAARCLLMGIDEDMEVRASVQKLNKGDMILFVSDGIIESKDVDNQKFGERRLEGILQKYRNEDPKALVQDIDKQVQDYLIDSEQHDDHSILVFKVL